MDKIVIIRWDKQAGPQLIVQYPPEKETLSKDLFFKIWAKYELNKEQLLWFNQTKPDEELYDLENDPHELHNLANDIQYKEKLEELRQAHKDWQANYGDLGYIPEENMIKAMWLGKDFPPSTENPAIDHSGGTVTLNCSTKGASIGYKINREGIEPSSWNVYTNPFDVKSGDTVKAVAHRIGYEPSQIIELKI